MEEGKTPTADSVENFIRQYARDKSRTPPIERYINLDVKPNRPCTITRERLSVDPYEPSFLSYQTLQAIGYQIEFRKVPKAKIQEDKDQKDSDNSLQEPLETVDIMVDSKETNDKLNKIFEEANSYEIYDMVRYIHHDVITWYGHDNIALWFFEDVIRRNDWTHQLLPMIKRAYITAYELLVKKRDPSKPIFHDYNKLYKQLKTEGLNALTPEELRVILGVFVFEDIGRKFPGVLPI